MGGSACSGDDVEVPAAQTVDLWLLASTLKLAAVQAKAEAALTGALEECPALLHEAFAASEATIAGPAGVSNACVKILLFLQIPLW